MEDIENKRYMSLFIEVSSCTFCKAMNIRKHEYEYKE